MTPRFAFAIFGFGLIAGCSSLRDRTMPPGEELLSGSGSLFTNTDKKTTEFENLNLGDLLISYGLVERPDSVGNTLENDRKYKRNNLQYHIISASNQRCAYYIRVIVASKAQTQMAWGGLATLLSGAASVVSPASTAALLAAGSTVANANLGLYNDSYFSDQTVAVIVTGIQKQREGIQAQIFSQRDASLIDYPVNKAIADALTYHAACNIVSGLQAAATATKQAKSTDIAPNILGIEFAEAQKTAASTAAVRAASSTFDKLLTK